jgi:predicted acyltransferase
MISRPPMRKISVLALIGAGGVALGFALTVLSPMIKRICTSSFVVASGGFCLLVLAFSYWFIDVRRVRGWTTFFNIVGMNSLLIYLFTESGGTSWIIRLVKPFMMAISGWAGSFPAELATSLAAWAVLWSMCYWLYARKIVIKI